MELNEEAAALNKAMFDAKVDCLIARADDLRAAGITRIRLRDFEAELAPPPPPKGEEGAEAPDGKLYESHPDPLMDGATFPRGSTPHRGKRRL